MFYTYIIFSEKTNRFYTGSTSDLQKRLSEHNSGLNQSTKNGMPWKLIFYAGLLTEKKAIQFEQYLKTGSGKAFLYKRLVHEALKKDGLDGEMAGGSEA
jgi:putative endonuclease